MYKISILFLLLVVTTFSSCKKGDFKGTDTSIPAVPVTVTNLFGIYNGVPTVATSVSTGGAISITLSIPASSGRTIKEITRVAVATVPSDYTKVEVATGLYNTSPISGSGTSVTFTTSLAEYAAKTATAVVTTGGLYNSFLGKYFMFLITLDNGDQIFPLGVRVYINS